jgi:beta-phosphoglucomutase-like phosphatase (HAD superfamily)
MEVYIVRVFAYGEKPGDEMTSREEHVKRPDAVLFDLDGLLADTEELHIYAYEAVGTYLGTPLARGYICSFIGGPTRENVKRVMRDFNVPMERFEEVLKVRYDSYVDAIARTVLRPMEGSLDCVLEVKERKYKTGLVTSSIRAHAMAVLQNLSNHWNSGRDIASLFDVTVFGDEIEHLKPAPDIYLEAVRRLGSSPESCTALEDSEFGVISAKRAGLYVIAVPGPHTKDQHFRSADVVAGSMTEVLERGLIP